MSKTLQKSQIASPSDPKYSSPLRRFLYAALWLFWMALLIVALILTYAWLNRYDYLEQAAKQALAENNIAADFKISKIGQSDLSLGAVVLRDLSVPNDPPFFSADKIEARYDWRDVVNGKIEKLTFTRPSAMFEVDEAGKLVAGWVPPNQNPDQGNETVNFTFPKEGLWVKEGHINLKTPYGVVHASVDGHIFDTSNFDAHLNVTRTRFSFKEYTAVMGGPLSVISKPDGYRVESDLQIERMNSNAVSLAPAFLETDLSIHKTQNQWNIEGLFNFGAENLFMQAFAADDVALRSEGLMSIALDGSDAALPALERISYKGAVDINAGNLALTNEIERNSLAQTLSLSETLSKSPILRDFSPELAAQTQAMLGGFDLDAKLFAEASHGQLRLDAQESINITKGAALWRMRGNQTGPLLVITPRNEAETGYRGVSDFEFTKSGPLPLNLSDGHMEFDLLTPNVLLEVSDFSGQIKPPLTWKTTGADGRATKLLARKADIGFKRSASQSYFTADTNFTLSGEVPGGYAQDFNGAGRVNITTTGTATQLEFKPRGALSYGQVNLTSGWILEDGELSLDTPFMMTGPPERSVIDLAASALKMRIHDNELKDFQTDIASISGQGVLELTGDILAQNWDLTLTDGRMTSAEFPIKDTHIFSPKADIKASLVSDELPVFEINSPRTQVGSSLVSTENIAVAIMGTSEDLTVDYDAELFRFADPALPQIPMRGQTRLVGTRWIGESIARLPEDPNAPIDISFEFEDGVGHADVEIETLNFTRKRLQPQNLVQSLSGKIGDVEGTVSTSIKLEFGEGIPLKSYGTTTFNSLDFGVLAGSVKGLSGTLEFTSFFPLETSGRQTLQLSSFDPGFPLPDGEIEFELLPGKIKIHRAEWLLGNGSIFIEPLIWDFEALENRAVLAVKNVPIQNVLKESGTSKLEITGEISGRLPILVSGVNVDVQNGTLAVPGGGNIKFSYAGTDLAGAQNQAVGVAFDALKDFEYDVFELDVNGPLDGLVRLRTVFSGSNQDVYAGQPFEFDVELEGELLNLMRELNPETQKNRALKGDIVDLLLTNPTPNP